MFCLKKGTMYVFTFKFYFWNKCVYVCKICGEGKINVGFTLVTKMFLSVMSVNLIYRSPLSDINYLFYYHGKSSREISENNIGPHNAKHSFP